MSHLLKKLRINGREVMTVGNQIIWELPDIELDETTDPMFPVMEEPAPEVKVRTKPKCICGSRSIGIGDYMTGHDKDCEVHEDKTPVL